MNNYMFEVVVKKKGVWKFDFWCEDECLCYYAQDVKEAISLLQNRMRQNNIDTYFIRKIFVRKGNSMDYIMMYKREVEKEILQDSSNNEEEQ